MALDIMESRLPLKNLHERKQGRQSSRETRRSAICCSGMVLGSNTGARLREEEQEASRSVEPCFLLGSGGHSRWYIGLDFQSSWPLPGTQAAGEGPPAWPRTCRGLRSAAFLPAALLAACGSRRKWALSGPVCSWPASGEEWTAPGTSWWWGCLLIPLHT